MTAKLILLKAQPLTPQEVLTACLHDDIEGVESVVVIRRLKGGVQAISFSKQDDTALAFAAIQLLKLAQEP